MADTFRSLADLVQINDLNARDNGVNDLLDDAPVMKALYSTTASNGTNHKYLKKTGNPVVGPRAVNAGRDNYDSTDTLVTLALAYFDADFALDVAYCKGYKGGIEAAIAKEAQAHLRALFASMESNLFVTTSGGFSGFADTFSAIGSKVISAGGTTDNTASSIYLVRSVPDETGVATVVGNDGKVEIGESSLIQKVGSNSKSFAAYLTTIGAWMGLQMGSAHSVARIANLTADTGKGATDALIYNALSTFPASAQPTHILMNRRSLEQLRKSRTATNATGAPAPRPVDVDGIPIITTDAILSTEALLS